MRPFDMSDPDGAGSNNQDQISQVAHWLVPHWGWLVSAAVAAIGAIWRAASLVSEIRALRKDHDRFAAEYRRDAEAWRRYVDVKFDAMNSRLDGLVDTPRNPVPRHWIDQIAPHIGLLPDVEK